MCDQIREVFTPAPPSNWGLPDDGRGYHYGKFPTLRADLFGKVRPPKQWPQQDAGTYRIVARAAALKQQELIAKSIGPSLSVPTLLTSSEGRPLLRDMDWAIRVLSRDTKEKVESRTSAQQQVLDARRKQGILVDIIIDMED